jgi:hypothetical protein
LRPALESVDRVVRSKSLVAARAAVKAWTIAAPVEETPTLGSENSFAREDAGAEVSFGVATVATGGCGTTEVSAALAAVPVSLDASPCGVTLVDGSPENFCAVTREFTESQGRPALAGVGVATETMTDFESVDIALSGAVFAAAGLALPFATLLCVFDFESRRMPLFAPVPALAFSSFASWLAMERILLCDNACS